MCVVFQEACVISAHVKGTHNRCVVFIHLSIHSHIFVCEVVRRTFMKVSIEAYVIKREDRLFCFIFFGWIEN